MTPYAIIYYSNVFSPQRLFKRRICSRADSNKSFVENYANACSFVANVIRFSSRGRMMYDYETDGSLCATVPESNMVYYWFFAHQPWPNAI